MASIKEPRNDIWSDFSKMFPWVTGKRIGNVYHVENSEMRQKGEGTMMRAAV